MKGYLYLEDGKVYEGKIAGEIKETLGEIVFNTSMTGYEEILTDPSYAGQIINMTYPLIGNYGINSFDVESNKIHAKGLVVKELSKTPSHYLNEQDLNNFLNSMGITALYDVDTRAITKRIREKGTMKCIISNEIYSGEKLKELFQKDFGSDFVKQVSTKEVVHIKGDGFKVALMDFGAKANIIRSLQERKCDITIFPYSTSAEEILSIHPDGVLLSNGPGDPKEMIEAVENVKKLMGKAPIFGICLGHQLLSLALGGDTYKLKYGHRGGNHGVHDIEKDKVYITSQNHSYAVEEESIKDKDIVITHVNLNDGTIEGIRHKHYNAFSVQFHPEGCPGPQDSAYLFEKFLDNMASGNKTISA